MLPAYRSAWPRKYPFGEDQMKVLLAHNFYRSSAPSGEDAVYRNERRLLEQHAEVIPYERFNDDIDDSTFRNKLRLALDGAWSRQTYLKVSALIRRHAPDVAHFHNTFPLISPSAYAACQDNGVAVVQTLHNYRLLCPNAMLLRDGRPCEDCVGSSLLPALRHRCYRGSLLATGAQVWTLLSNRWRGMYRNCVNRYIALTSFAAQKMIAGGLPAHRVEIKPNFLPEPPRPGGGEGGYAVYVGRLSAEKGVATLLEAWRSMGERPLKFVGDGPLREVLQTRAVGLGLPAEFLGLRDKSEILKIVGNAAIQIIPSECYEGLPMVLVEAYACATPVAVSRIGSLDAIVREGATGVKFEAGSAADLAAAVRNALGDPYRLAHMREQARAEFLRHYTAETNYRLLTAIYERAIQDHRQATTGITAAMEV